MIDDNDTFFAFGKHLSPCSRDGFTFRNTREGHSAFWDIASITPLARSPYPPPPAIVRVEDLATQLQTWQLVNNVLARHLISSASEHSRAKSSISAG